MIHLINACAQKFRRGRDESEFRYFASLLSHPVPPRVCKRCLASLAKRDREFRAKARAGIKHLNYIGFIARQPGVTGAAARERIMLRNSVRAIAREEGRDALRDFGRAIGLCS